MAEAAPQDGWAGLAAVPPPPGRTAAEERRLEVACARCFAGEDGAVMLGHLRALTLDRALGPGAGDAALRHLEGQRALVLHLLALAARGRGAERTPC